MQGLGAFIRRLRDERDISLRELAKRLDCSAAFISDVELGRRHPSEAVLKDIARELGTTVDELRKHDVRPPLDEIKRIAQSDPKFALAFRTMVEKVDDKRMSADDLLELVKNADGRRSPKKK